MFNEDPNVTTEDTPSGKKRTKNGAKGSVPKVAKKSSAPASKGPAKTNARKAKTSTGAKAKTSTRGTRRKKKAAEATKVEPAATSKPPATAGVAAKADLMPVLPNPAAMSAPDLLRSVQTVVQVLTEAWLWLALSFQRIKEEKLYEATGCASWEEYMERHVNGLRPSTIKQYTRGLAYIEKTEPKVIDLVRNQSVGTHTYAVPTVEAVVYLNALKAKSEKSLISTEEYEKLHREAFDGAVTGTQVRKEAKRLNHEAKAAKKARLDAESDGDSDPTDETDSGPTDKTDSAGAPDDANEAAQDVTASPQTDARPTDLLLVALKIMEAQGRDSDAPLYSVAAGLLKPLAMILGAVEATQGRTAAGPDLDAAWTTYQTALEGCLDRPDESHKAHLATLTQMLCDASEAQTPSQTNPGTAANDNQTSTGDK